MSGDLIATYGLTPTQNAAVCEYLRNGFNKKAAASSVGCGVYLFNDPRVINAIADQSRSILADTNMRAVAVVKHLGDIIFANVDDFYEIRNGHPVLRDDLDREKLALVSEFTETKDGRVRVKLHDKNKAIDQISKLLEWTKEQAAINIVLNQAEQADPVDVRELARRLLFEARAAEEVGPERAMGNITDVEIIDGDGIFRGAADQEYRVQDDSLGDDY